MSPSGRRFGKYDLLAHLATGGMAEIWLARISGVAGFEKLVVIKRLLDSLAASKDYVEMFLDEARLNARLQHANVVTVLELGQVEGKYFMAMEYVPGMAVSAVGKRATQRLGAVPQEVACGIVAQAAAGLHYAHERRLPDGSSLNVVHRDVSPQNLIITWEGLLKVVDFGIARSAVRHTLTATGMVKGKSAYMSPEQCLGQTLDRRSDIFSLGIILFELCTSRRLFKRPSSYQTLQAIAAVDIPTPREMNPAIDKAVEAVVMRALAKRREDRFSTAEELQEALEYAMHKAGLRGTRGDLEKFIDKTFPDEIEEHRGLLATATSGGSGPAGSLARLSAVAIEAAAESRDSYARPPEQEDPTEVDHVMLPLGDEPSAENSLPDVNPPAESSERDTSPRGVKALEGGSRPPLHYLLAFLAVGAAIVIVYFLLRR